MSLAGSHATERADVLRTGLRTAGWVGLGLILITVALSEFIARVPADAQNIGPVLAAPSAQFLFGTDLLGRDIFSETLHALSETAGAAVIAALIALVAGGLFGFVAARLPRHAGLGLRWIAGILASAPVLLLAILFLAMAGREWASIAAGFASAPLAFVRAYERTRAEGHTRYAEYARATGISAATLLRRDLMYEFRDSLFITVARALAATTITLSTVSFLGFGAVPPQRDLGLMIAAARETYLDAWWTAGFPALALLLLILCARLAAGLEEGERP
jgi:peptide/nickel transport system permease protein